MAFDQPLEADRVDNLSLLSSIVRAPIIAPVMWMLGGFLSDDKEDAGSMDKSLEEDLTENSSTSQKTKLEEICRKSRSFSGDQIERPQVTRGNFSGLRGSSGDVHGLTRTISVDSKDGIEKNNSPTPALPKKIRKMSWADESGQTLDEYYDESNNSSHPQTFPPQDSAKMATTGNRKPIKSAIRNSRVCGNKEGAQMRQPSQCVPYMPTNSAGKGCSTSSANNGYISPQWGWYITTTPPTPEYHSTSKNKMQVLSHPLNTKNPQASHTVGNHTMYGHKQPWNPSTTPIQEAPPKFTKGAPDYSSGWPSVPL